MNKEIRCPYCNKKIKAPEAVKWGSQGGNATLKKKGKKYFKLLAAKRWAGKK